ncbi:MAG: RNA polymerase sigma factor [Bryobacteraceae bacterium]|nr:RNA polymerase sigma factor [Bryobacteraceae bacterium]
MDREGASAAVTRIFDLWYPAVVRYAYHACGSLELAEEFAQEAFAALYRTLRGGAEIENPRAWMLAAIRNQTAKHWRFRRRHPEDLVPNNEFETRSAPGNGDPEPDGASLQDYLSILTSREEEVVVLRAQGLKYGQIASQLGISSNSVGTLLMRAIRKIRKARGERMESERTVAG